MNHTETETEKEVELVAEIETKVSEERQTIVHCTCTTAERYRIWPSTFLVERGTGKKAKLLTTYNISFAPEWTANDGKGFTLIFEGLSKQCSVFDLIELIPQSGAFEVKGIIRNNTDVYRIQVD